jgi:hypothetical protein
MYKVQIFQDTLGAVSEETGLEENKILSNAKSEEIVDARSILIKVMEEQGLYPIQISHLSGICQRSVNRFLVGFKERSASRKIMRLYYVNVKKKLGIE